MGNLRPPRCCCWTFSPISLCQLGQCSPITSGGPQGSYPSSTQGLCSFPYNITHAQECMHTSPSIIEVNGKAHIYRISTQASEYRLLHWSAIQKKIGITGAWSEHAAEYGRRILQWKDHFILQVGTADECSFTYKTLAGEKPTVPGRNALCFDFLLC